MIAKLICVGSSRESAIRRMARALSEYLISGIKTTIPFHTKIMQNPDFIRGDFDTSFVEKMAGPKRLELKL
jgi:acetyl-CoA carboxylase biotin carboxylase subunit